MQHHNHEIAIFQGQRAADYDGFANAWIPFYPQLLGSLPQLITTDSMTAVEKVLVVGSGTGNGVLALAQQRPNWKILGIDPSADLVAQAREKLSGFAVVDLREGYVQDLPEQTQYDAATLMLVLHFLPDDGSKLELLMAIAKRMKPGATLVLADIYGSERELAAGLQLLRRLLPLHLDKDTVDQRMAMLPQRIKYISEARLSELLIQSGFEPPRRFFQAAIYGAWLTRKR